MVNWYVQRTEISGLRSYRLYHAMTFNLPSGERTVDRNIVSLIFFPDGHIGVAEGMSWMLDKMPAIVRYQDILNDDDFRVKNRRRCDLIIKDIEGEATREELEEFDHLQRIVREYINMKYNEGVALEFMKFRERELEREISSREADRSRDQDCGDGGCGTTDPEPGQES